MDVLITSAITSRRSFYAAMSKQLVPERSPITNADGLADALRERHVEHVIATDWRMELREELVVLAVFRDLGITLKLHEAPL